MWWLLIVLSFSLSECTSLQLECVSFTSDVYNNTNARYITVHHVSIQSENGDALCMRDRRLPEHCTEIDIEKVIDVRGPAISALPLPFLAHWSPPGLPGLLVRQLMPPLSGSPAAIQVAIVVDNQEENQVFEIRLKKRLMYVSIKDGESVEFDDLLVSCPPLHRIPRIYSLIEYNPEYRSSPSIPSPQLLSSRPVDYSHTYSNPTLPQFLEYVVENTQHHSNDLVPERISYSRTVSANWPHLWPETFNFIDLSGNMTEKQLPTETHSRISSRLRCILLDSGHCDNSTTEFPNDQASDLPNVKIHFSAPSKFTNEVKGEEVLDQTPTTSGKFASMEADPSAGNFKYSKNNQDSSRNDNKGFENKIVDLFAWCDLTNPFGNPLCPFPMPYLVITNIIIKCLVPGVILPFAEILAPQIIAGRKTEKDTAAKILLELDTMYSDTLDATVDSVTKEALLPWKLSPQISDRMFDRLSMRRMQYEGSFRLADALGGAPNTRDVFIETLKMEVNSDLASSFLSMEEKVGREAQGGGTVLVPNMATALVSGLTPVLTEAITTTIVEAITMEVVPAVHDIMVDHLELSLLSGIGSDVSSMVSSSVSFSAGKLIPDMLVKVLPSLTLENYSRIIVNSTARAVGVSSSIAIMNSIVTEPAQMYYCYYCQRSSFYCSLCNYASIYWLDMLSEFNHYYTSQYSEHYTNQLSWDGGLFSQA